ncbi:MAG: hypothetical protein V3W34_09510 [Phycisphaerae bacterium]
MYTAEAQVDAQRLVVNKSRLILALAVLVCWQVPVSVRADVCPGSLSEATAPSLKVDHPPHERHAARHPASAGPGVFDRRLESLGGHLDSLGLSQLCPIVVPRDVTGAPAGEIKEFPPSPGSAELLLSAVFSVGVWHLLRSTRHVHLGHLPEWVHPEGPAQVGHAVTYDFDPYSVPLCRFERPASEQPVSYRPWRDPRRRCDAQVSPTVAVPRGPPAGFPGT